MANIKFIIFTVCMTAAVALTVAASARSLDPFSNTTPDLVCGKPVADAFRAFAIITPILAGFGFFAGIAGIFVGTPLKIPAAILGILTFIFAIPSWAIIAYYWDSTYTVSGTAYSVPGCGFPYGRPDFLAMYVPGSAMALIGAIILFVMPDAAAAAAAKPGADAGNTSAAPQVKAEDNKKPEEKKQQEQQQHESPAPKEDDSKAQKEAEEKKRKDAEAAEAEKKRKEQEQADADAAAKKKQQQDQDAAAAAAAEKQRKDAEAAEAEKKRKDAEAAEAEKKRKDAEAAEAEKKRKEQEQADAAAKAKAKPQINWKEVNAKLPYDKKNPEQKKKRFEMFDKIDVNKTGKVSLSEVTAGMEAVLGLGKEINVPVVIKTAFDKAKVAGQQAGVNSDDAAGGDFIEKNEFRLFLMYTRMYFELFQLFSALDETGDMLIEIGEFEKAVPLLKTWGAKIEDAKATFKQIDKNGGGKVLFDEFVDWALSPEQNLDCPDDDE